MDAWKDSISKYIPTWSGASGASAGQADSGAPIEPTLSDDEAELSYPNTDEEDFGEEDSGEYEDDIYVRRRRARRPVGRGASGVRTLQIVFSGDKPTTMA